MDQAKVEDQSSVDSVCSSPQYLAFVVGEWFSKTVLHLGKQAFDSRELGRAMLSLSYEAVSLPPEYGVKLLGIQEAMIRACVESDGGGIGYSGPSMLEDVRLAVAGELT